MVKSKKKITIKYKSYAYSKTTAGTGWLMDSGEANPPVKKHKKSLAELI